MYYCYYNVSNKIDSCNNLLKRNSVHNVNNDNNSNGKDENNANNLDNDEYHNEMQDNPFRSMTN